MSVADLQPTPTIDRPLPNMVDTAAEGDAGREISRMAGRVTLRAFTLGFVLTAAIAWLNCWMSTVHGNHMVGGIQMPFGALTVLLILVLFINLPLRFLARSVAGFSRFLPPFSMAELLTIYPMMLIGSLLSTPGCDNVFLAGGPTLFYYAKPENKWASLFYQHVPSWFAPGWNGTRYQQEVIQQFYLGNSHIPWHAWAVMLIAWNVFMLLCYAVLFFLALLLRKQWTEYEALAFPLVEVPLQMVNEGSDTEKALVPPLWRQNMMWIGFGVAFAAHFLNGMYSHNTDWPAFPVNVFGGVRIAFPDRPWNAMPRLTAEVFLGGIGLGYMLTREVAFSFWFFYIVMSLEFVIAEMLGFPAASLPKSGIMSRPDFINYQGVGGWVMMAVLLVWMAREHLWLQIRQAFSSNKTLPGEPFSPRVAVFGFLLSFIGLLAWSSFAGINLAIAAIFFGIFVLTSLVLTRLVVEGGFMFPQAPYYPLEWMTNGMLGASTIGAANLTKLSFIQPMLLVDMRTCLLPAFLHTMKFAEALKLDRRQQRRLLVCILVAIPLTLAVTAYVSLLALYTKGGLGVYSWFSSGASVSTFNASATAIKSNAPVNPTDLLWMAVGASVVWLLIFCRGRFTWFMFHPLGYISAPAYPITRLWFSFFLAWLIKSLVMKYGGSSTYTRLRPFMLGLILGNAASMMLWSGIAYRTGNIIKYWPA